MQPTRGRLLATPMTMVALVLLAFYLIIVAAWAVRPMSYTVAVGTDYNAKPARAVSEHVRCLSPLSSGARDAGKPLKALAAQPAGKPALEYPENLCTEMHRQARILFLVDSAITVVGLMACGSVIAWRYRADRRPTPFVAFG